MVSSLANTFASYLSKQITSILKVLPLLVLLLFPLNLQPLARDLDVVVIAHPSENQSQIRRRTLRAIFGMRMHTWPEGRSITVFMLEDDSLHYAFCRDILGMLPYQLKKNWDRLLFSGTGQIPIVVSDEQEMKTRVATIPGAIGYISREYIDESVSALQVKK